jgi:hypothetical protein
VTIHAKVQLARLYDQEKMERDERRGLETRATGFISALLVATGLAVNGDPKIAPSLAIVAATFDGIAIALSFFPLIGLHATQSESAWGAVKEALHRRRADIALRDVDDALELEGEHARVRRLVRANAAAVTCLRFAGFATVLSACCFIYGSLSS